MWRLLGVYDRIPRKGKQRVLRRYDVSRGDVSSNTLIKRRRGPLLRRKGRLSRLTRLGAERIRATFRVHDALAAASNSIFRFFGIRVNRRNGVKRIGTLPQVFGSGWAFLPPPFVLSPALFLRKKQKKKDPQYHPSPFGCPRA